MNERKSPDDSEQLNDGLNDGLNEDFGFGEAETEARPIQTTTGHGTNKKLLMVILLLGIIVIGAMAYRFYSNPKHPSNTTSQENSSKLTAIVTQNESMHNSTASQPSSAPSTATASKIPENAEPNFSDIAQAFSSADHPSNTAVAPKPVNHSTPLANEGNIHQLQKELFAPEKTTEPSTGTAPTNAFNAEISSKETVQLSQNLNKLNNQIDYILNQIKYLDSYTRDVSDNLNKLNDAINTMDARINAVTNTTSTLSKDVGSVRNEIGQFKNVLQDDGLDLSAGTAPSTMTKKKPDHQEDKITIEEPEYTVHAVIPGRAWLKSSKGQQIITVAEGDAVGNYGKILVIDAANGVVLTSSGIAFR